MYNFFELHFFTWMLEQYMSTGIQFIEMRHIQAKKWSCCLEEKTTAGSIKIKLFFYGKCANVAFIAVEKI